MIDIKRPFYVDVDDTLILWNISEYQDRRGEFQTLTLNGYPTEILPHRFNINLVKKFAKMGYMVIVHSQSGIEHARSVVLQLGLEDYVSAVGDKPTFMLDDKGVSGWAAQIWRHPTTGEELGARQA